MESLNASITAALDEDFLVNLILVDTSGYFHTTGYLTKFTKEVLSNCEINFKCSIHSLVPDNVNTIESMRQ